MVRKKEKEIIMPSVTTITSYKPVTGIVSRTGKNLTQHAKINRIALTIPKLREMVNEQMLVTTDDNSQISRGIYARTEGDNCNPTLCETNYD